MNRDLLSPKPMASPHGTAVVLNETRTIDPRGLQVFFPIERVPWPPDLKARGLR